MTGPAGAVLPSGAAALPAGAVVAVTGATGQLGQALLERFICLATSAGEQGASSLAGTELRTLSRRPLPRWLAAALQGGPASSGGPQGAGVKVTDEEARPGPTAAHVVHTCADVRSLAAREAIEGADLVVHLAARIWPGSGVAAREEMRSVNLDGTLNVLAARPKAVVFASSAAVYGAWPDNPLPLGEDWEPRPNAECQYAVDKLLGEQAVAEGVQRWAVLRLCAVLGPHADRRVSRSLAGYRWAVPEVRGCPQALQWLDEADAAEAIWRAGADLLGPGRASGQVLNVATKDWLGAPQMATLASSRVLSAPRRLVLAAAELGRRAGLSPFGADRAALICGPLALSPEKAADLLSWQPSKSSREVFAAALARGWRQAPRNR